MVEFTVGRNILKNLEIRVRDRDGNYKMIKELELKRVEDIANITIKEGVLYFVYLPSAIVDLEKAKKMVAEKIALCKQINYPCLIDIRFLKSISAEAQSYYTNSEGGNANILAAAILVESTMSKMLGNLYLTINTPRMPSKLFTDKKLALEWLSKYKA